MNIIDPILFQCRVGGTNPALCVPGLQNSVVTYSQLGRMIENVTAALRPYGLQGGQVVGVYVADKILHFVLTLALIRLGFPTVSCRERGLPPSLDAQAIFVDKSGPVSNAKQVYLINKTMLTATTAMLAAEKRPAVDESAPCRLILTSGTTGAPRAVAFNQIQLFQRLSRFHFSFCDRFSQCLRIFCDLGLTTSLGFLVPVFYLMRGGLVYFYGDDGLASLQGLNLYRVQNMITSPYNIANYIDFLQGHPSFHIDLDHLVLAGSPVEDELLNRIWSRICPRVFNQYGATEVGTVASADLRRLHGVPGAVGYVQPGANVEIVDNSGARLDKNFDGKIRIRTDEMAVNYHADPTASGSTFRDRWFYPGDVGRLTFDGLLVVTGREDLIINIGGDKMKLEHVEERLSGYPGIVDVAVAPKAGVSGRVDLQAFIVTKSDIDQKQLMDYWRSKLQPAFVPTSVMSVSSIPRNDMGKIDRSHLLMLSQ